MARRASLLRSAHWTVVDQGLFGLSNLALNVLLARWLAPEAYGLFATALAVLFLAGILHGALFVEPMLVLGAKRREAQPQYLQLLVAGHALFGVVALALCAAVAAALWGSGGGEAAAVTLALGVAVPGVLTSWLARRLQYLRATPRTAATASAANLVLVLAGTAAVHAGGVLSSVTALLVLAAVNAGVALALIASLRLPLFEGIDRASARALLDEHWSLSRWLVLATPFEWIPGSYYYVVLPTAAGLEASALLKASMNLVQPLMQLFGALRILLVPVFVDAPRSLARPVRAAAAMAGAAVAWYVLLFVAGGPLVRLLYGPAYAEAAALLRVLGLVPICFAVASVGSALLRAREKTGQELAVGIVASGTSLVVGLPLMGQSGAHGAAVALVASYATFAVCRLVLLAWARTPAAAARDSSAVPGRSR